MSDQGSDHLTPAFLSSSHSITTASISLPRDLQAASTAAPTKGHADAPAPVRPTAPLVPLTQPTSTGGRDSSLSGVFVPLSSIKPSE